ncbi:MAG: nucleoside/nucleotide kinase family protein [Actinomycetota bacterium]|nr:nucleoside/nucleotide kinase family protein [Actinomycetota bacterium]
MLTVDDALARARRLAAGGARALLGIAGPPGAGKSTLAEHITADLGARARIVGMDGFHLAQTELVRLRREHRKGAIDTFDVAGYVALLRRLRDPAEDVVYAPVFRRDLEEPIGSAVPVGPDVPLVIAEGNYLLVADGPWGAVRALLDEAWYVATPHDARRHRLIERHMAFGRSPDAARAWTLGPDERNAELVERTRGRGDHVVRVP